MIGQCIRHYVHFPTPPGTAGSSFLITKPSCFRGPTQHYKPLSFNEMSGQYMITARYHITNMDRELVPKRDMVSGGAAGVPAVVMAAGEKAGLRFVEFFTANIRNPNTRRAYHRACTDFFRWCGSRGLQLERIGPVHVAAYIEKLGKELSRPSVKLQLAAIRMLFDWLVTGQVIPTNPAHAVRGPRHSVKKGKTPVLTADEGRVLLDSIAVERDDKKAGKITSLVVGLRESRAHRPHGLHVRARGRRDGHECRGLVFPGPALVGAAA